MKSTNIVLLILVVTSISVGSVVFADNMHVRAQETGNSVISSFNATNENENGNLTIGNLIYEGRGEINSQTVLQGLTVQTSFSSNYTVITCVNN